MPPLTNAAVLVVVYADSILDHFIAASLPPTPNVGTFFLLLSSFIHLHPSSPPSFIPPLTHPHLHPDLPDRIVNTGVTTGLMLSESELTAAATAHSLEPQIHNLAISQCAPSGIASIHADEAAVFFSNRPPSARVFLIDAGSDFSLADAAAEEASLAFSSRVEHEPTRSSNPAVPATAAALIGVLVAGRGEWGGMLPMPFQEGFGADFPLPRQSFETGSEKTKLSGFVAWSGEGLVRKDERTHLGHAGTPPGEGFLRLEQVVAEALSKTGLLDKYGA